MLSAVFRESTASTTAVLPASFSARKEGIEVENLAVPRPAQPQFHLDQRAASLIHAHLFEMFDPARQHVVGLGTHFRCDNAIRDLRRPQERHELVAQHDRRRLDPKMVMVRLHLVGNGVVRIDDRTFRGQPVGDEPIDLDGTGQQLAVGCGARIDGLQAIEVVFRNRRRGGATDDNQRKRQSHKAPDRFS